MSEERDRLTLARAEHALIKKAILDGRLIGGEYASARWHVAAADARARLKAMPMALSTRLGLTPAKVEALAGELDRLAEALFNGADDDG